MERLSILGSTGSIGKTTLDVVAKHHTEFRIVALAARDNITDLEYQARQFRPRLVAVWNAEKASILKKRLRRLRIKVLSGDDGLETIAASPGCDRIVFSLSGIKGLKPLIIAIKSHKDIAIANKELLVIAGPLIRRLITKHDVYFIPIDSEHSAIFQCLEGRNSSFLKRIIITASGGPFIDYPSKSLQSVTPRQALRHPRWKMGRKITIDSATLMNKGLEIIEAAQLYNVNADQIEVVVHRESIVHSLVEFIDGSMLAQLSTTDMCFPIAYALSYPRRLHTSFQRLDLAAVKQLTFEKPDYRRFPCLRLAYNAVRAGGTMMTVLNAANEMAVELFLANKITFMQIPRIIKNVMQKHTPIRDPSVNDILRYDIWARREAQALC